MSIATAGSGILKTHVIWEDIEGALYQTTGEICKFGENTTISDIGKGNGLLSKIALVQTNWKEPKPTIPNTFVVKILSLLPQVELEPSVADQYSLHEWFKKGHNREVLTYQALWKYKTESLPLPKIFASRLFTENNDSKGFIVMEYIENAFVKPAVEDVALEDLDKALDAVAALVGVTAKMAEEEKAIYPKDLISGVASFYSPEMISSQIKDIQNFIGDDEKELVDHLADEARFFLSSKEMIKLDKIPETLGMEPVLSHGDLWSPNILWRKDDNHLTLAAILDFQIANMGTVAADLVTIACSTLSCEVRKDNYHDIMEMFYTKITSQNNSPSFTLVQLEMACDRVFPLCAYNAMSSMVSVIPNLDLSKYNTSKQQCATKVKGLIEDIIEASRKLRNISAQEA